VQTPLIAFVDSDCLLPDGWLAPLLAHFDDPMIGAVAPRVVGPDPPARTWIERFEHARPVLDRGPFPALVRPRTRVPFVPTAALLIRRDLIDSPAFDESLPLGEDVDLIWRIVDAGWDVRYEPSVQVRHESRPDVWSWARQRAGYGKSAAPLSLRHPGNLSPASLPVLTTSAVLLAGRRHPWSAAALLALASALAARRLGGRVEHPVSEAARLVARGTIVGTAVNAAGLARAWGPALAALAVAGRRTPAGRAAGAVLLVPALIDWRRSGRSMGLFRYAVAHVVDDVVYGSGVWAGCVRARTVRPLVPEVAAGRRTWPARAGRAQAEPNATTPRMLRPALRSS
jgi:mycofactocin system glycosyltransferase